jgi:hypothetical protein
MDPSRSPRAGLLTAMAIQVLLSPWWLTGTVILTNMRPPLEPPTSLDYGLRIVLIAVWFGLTVMLVFFVARRSSTPLDISLPRGRRFHGVLLSLADSNDCFIRGVTSGNPRYQIVFTRRTFH